MNAPTYQDFYEAYCCLAKALLNAEEVTVRGLKTKEVLGASFRVNDVTKRVKLEKNRETYLFGELLWYLAGSYDVEEISPFSSFWKKIATDGKVNSNYGHRILRQEKTFFNALRQLEKDIYSRQAIAHINLPRDIRTDNKDIPCTMFLHFFVRESKLNLIVYMRSNDIWRGLTYDFYAFVTFQQLMLKFLRERVDSSLQLGWYQHTVGSLHVYEPDYEKLVAFKDSSGIDGHLILREMPIAEDGFPHPSAVEAFHNARDNKDRVKAEISKIFDLS